jgi:hypothetical protein
MENCRKLEFLAIMQRFHWNFAIVAGSADLNHANFAIANRLLSMELSPLLKHREFVRYDLMLW